MGQEPESLKFVEHTSALQEINACQDIIRAIVEESFLQLWHM